MIMLGTEFCKNTKMRDFTLTTQEQRLFLEREGA